MPRIPSTPPRARPPALAALAALGALAALPGCGPEARPPNVVLLSLDTVRADHLSAYGYGVRTTPELEELCREATRFERALSTAPWTLPSHASMFTGLYPFEHGARTYRVESKRKNTRGLAPGCTTIAEVLAEEGYATGAFAANTVYLKRDLRLDQGFETYQVARRRARGMNELAGAWLDERDERPFFLFVNYMDAHRPYHAAPREGLLPREVHQEKGLLDEIYAPIMRGEDVAPELVQAVIDQYDTAIANLDEELGRLFDRLRDEGLWEDALVIVTSDHGEYFGEHALVEHSKDVYQEAIHVPLIVKAPRQREPRVEEGWVSLAALPRMILEALPAEARARHEGAFPPYRIGAPLLAESYYARLKDLFGVPWGDRMNRERRGYLEGGLKLIHSSDGAHELYDLGADPEESDDLFGRRPERAEAMLGAFDAFLSVRRKAEEEGPEGDYTPEEIRALIEMGYLAEEDAPP